MESTSGWQHRTAFDVAKNLKYALGQMCKGQFTSALAGSLVLFDVECTKQESRSWSFFGLHQDLIEMENGFG